MSLTRQRYDECFQKEQDKISLAPSLYTLNRPIQCNPCYQGNPAISQNKAGRKAVGLPRFNAGPVDLETQLRNGRKGGLCDNSRPQCSLCGNPAIGTYCDECANDLLVQEDCYFPTEPTRLSNPPCTLRGIGINRFNPLCHDPQEQVLFPAAQQTDSRNLIKDCWRPIVPIPAVNELPPGGKIYDNCFQIGKQCFLKY